MGRQPRSVVCLQYLPDPALVADVKDLYPRVGLEDSGQWSAARREVRLGDGDRWLPDAAAFFGSDMHRAVVAHDEHLSLLIVSFFYGGHVYIRIQECLNRRDPGNGGS